MLSGHKERCYELTIVFLLFRCDAPPGVYYSNGEVKVSKVELSGDPTALTLPDTEKIKSNRNYQHRINIMYGSKVN